jgi:hypothetical protein
MLINQIYHRYFLILSFIIYIREILLIKLIDLMIADDDRRNITIFLLIFSL